MPVYKTEIAQAVIGCAIEVHRALGPGLLESVYRRCLAREFELKTIDYAREVRLPVVYKGETLDCGYRCDFLIKQELLLEVKAIDQLLPIHSSQVLTYLKLLNCRQGLLINFNVSRLVEGLKSVVLQPFPIPSAPSGPEKRLAIENETEATSAGRRSRPGGQRPPTRGHGRRKT